ncbi:DNA polymerase alpha subunit A [Nematocida parisii]|nr:DNA polymerase alpha subunit A [Nematocida parisii]KAI5130331.1 DNA polymerase alpha subunit A [Nematocida parisii]
MQVYVLNILSGENHSVVLQCVEKSTGNCLNVHITDVVNEVTAAPISERAITMDRLEEEVLTTYKNSLVPIVGEKLSQWENRTVCYDSRNPERNGAVQKRLIFHLLYDKARSLAKLENSFDITKEFSSPMEAFILLKKIKGPTLMHINRIDGEVVRMQDINTVSYGTPPIRIAYLYFLQRNMFETVSICIYKSTTAEPINNPDENHKIRTETIHVKKQKLDHAECTESSEFVKCPESSTLCDAWTFTTLESPFSSDSLLTSNITRCIDSEAVISRVGRFLNESNANMIVCYNADTSLIREKLLGRKDSYNFLAAFSPICDKISLICDISQYFESVCRLTEYTLEEMCKSYSLEHADIPVCGSADSLQMVYSAIRNGHASDSVLVQLNTARVSAATMHAIFTKGNLLALAEKLAYITGALLNPIFHGYKSDRVEYLLLHRMRDNQYLIPRKSLGGKISDKDTYEGGYVFLDKPGVYSERYIALFDFNSLYPSIIQEYNVCFSTSHCLKMDNTKESTPSLLPGALRDLVTQRSEIKRQMKSGAGNIQLLEIEQRAVKLVANCIYGCLGFKGFRFYNKTMAAFITECGRTILKDTKATLESKGLQVIYGDTDSVMVDTGIKITDPSPSLETLSGISELISCKYNNIKLGFEKTFSKLVMMAKKKYFGIYCLNGADVIEEKGLETGRRDWCLVARETISAVMRILLFSPMPEEEILRMLSSLKESMKSRDKESYLIRKKIQKNPESYNAVQTTSLQQVCLALRLKQERGLTFHGGDIISFVIALHNGISRPELVSERSEIHYDYYMKLQVFPPLQRMLEHFSSISIENIQKVLGLYTSHNKPVQKAQYSNVSPETKDALSILSPCCSHRQDMASSCAACGSSYTPTQMKKLLRTIIYKQSIKLYAVKRWCFKCCQVEEYSPNCLKCLLPIEWKETSPENFHAFLYKLQEMFFGTPYEQSITDILSISNYLSIDISKFPLNRFSGNLYIPSMINRRNILDKLFL